MKREREKKGVDERVTAFLLHERSTGMEELLSGKWKGKERKRGGGEEISFFAKFYTT